MFKRFFLQVATILMIVIPGLSLAQPTTDADRQSLLSAFVSYTDLRMNSVRQNLAILAASDEARSANWKRMEKLLGAYQKSDDGLVVWFVRPDGSYYTVEKGLMNVTLSDREYFPGLMSGKEVMGSLVISKSTGRRSAIIAVPVVKAGKVIGAIGASLFLDNLSAQLSAALSLRPEAGFFAMAPNGQTTLHKQTVRHFVDPREQGSETLKQAANTMLSNAEGAASYEFDQVTRNAIYRTSPLTGWKFVITTQ